MSTPQEQVCISISLPRETLQGVDSIAREQDRSRSKVIARALSDLLAEQAQQRAASDAAARDHLAEHRRLTGIEERNHGD